MGSHDFGERDLRQRLEERADDELLEILRRRDSDEWQPSVFAVVEEVLRGRGIDVAQAAAPVPDRPADEGEGSVVTVARFPTVAESEACRTALLAAGFDVVGANEFVLRVDPALSPVLGGFGLAVPLSQAADAREFLAAAEGGELSAGLMECPTCASADVEAERSVSRGGTLFNTLLTGARIEDRTLAYRCRKCGATWQ
jgi:hypothetical protein